MTETPKSGRPLRCTHHPDTAQTACPACQAATEQDRIHTRDLYMRLLGAQGRYERSVRSAAVRAAEENANAFGDTWAHNRMLHASGAVTGLVYQVGEWVPPEGGRISTDHAHKLRHHAWLLGEAIKDHQQPLAYTTEPARAEAIRIRAAAVTAGQRLHTQLGTDDRDGQPCRCAGCELIRDLDDIDVCPPATAELHTAQATARAAFEELGARQ